eukprot:1316208-Amorphochlora_amoeboformis.AAC.2
MSCREIKCVYVSPSRVGRAKAHKVLRSSDKCCQSQQGKGEMSLTGRWGFRFVLGLRKMKGRLYRVQRTPMRRYGRGAGRAMAAVCISYENGFQ